MNVSVRAAGLAAAVTFAVSLLAAPASAAPFPELTLPFAAGQQVYSAGIHSDDGTSGVKNAIDFSPADGTVRAPLAGTVHLQHCAGGDWVTVDHPGGWRTGYYHLEDIRVTEGEQVAAGAVLGSTGNALPCGGSSTGAHVHFTLWTLPDATAGDWDGVAFARISTEVAAALGEPVDGKTFGGWRFAEGAEQYSGTATHLADGQVVQLPGRFRATL
ncbi:M23 family metallopeptidase [Amycolatopsis sp.]|uniref:M23 family metallopeptidase n=1 Tax=Amycolatopsis sp. TaxID=37632 RepID=UPI002D80C07B|nr:M23 family metallopeptidase [Amycolatopsis sp.]HET6709329.1 M23 family metallopeptidase [Amycolatopsis sp.]